MNVWAGEVGSNASIGLVEESGPTVVNCLLATAIVTIPAVFDPFEL